MKPLDRETVFRTGVELLNRPEGQRKIRLIPGSPEATTTYYTALVGLRWARCGAPLLAPTRELAASLMATSIGQEPILFTWPWDCFAVAVPQSLIPGIDTAWFWKGSIPGGPPNDSDSDHSYIYAHTPDLHIGRARTLADFTSDEEWEDEPEQREDEPEQREEVRRRTVLVCRLLLGCAIELERAKFEHPTKYEMPHRTRPPTNRRGAPTAWVFQLARPVRTDCRKFVVEYLSGTRNKINVQILVRGHHKQQPYGPRSELRKWIHIEPYWKGRENAPIAVRPHILGDSR